MRPRSLCCGKPNRRHGRSSAERKSGAATAVIGAATAVGVAPPGVVAPGEAAAMVAVVTVGVAAPTTAAEGTAAAEAEEARLGAVVARDPVRSLHELAGAVAAALEEAVVDDGTARKVVQLVTVLLSARPRLQARTAARSLW